MDRAEIIAAIESMTVLELAELVKELEEKFGVPSPWPPRPPLPPPLNPLKKRPSST